MAQYNVKANDLLLQHGANPFSRDFLNRTQREAYEDALSRDARSPIWTKSGTRQNTLQIVELLKAAEEKWLETHPDADVPPPPSRLAKLLATNQPSPVATPGTTG